GGGGVGGGGGGRGGEGEGGVGTDPPGRRPAAALAALVGPRRADARSCGLGELVVQRLIHLVLPFVLVLTCETAGAVPPLQGSRRDPGLGRRTPANPVTRT